MFECFVVFTDAKFLIYIKLKHLHLWKIVVWHFILLNSTLAHSNYVGEMWFFLMKVKKLCFKLSPFLLYSVNSYNCMTPPKNHILSKHKKCHIFSFISLQTNRDAATLVSPMSPGMFGSQNHVKYVSVTPDLSSAMT